MGTRVGAVRAVDVFINVKGRTLAEWQCSDLVHFRDLTGQLEPDS